MPGNAFVDFPNRTLPTAATKVTLSVKRVIIGQNRNDFAVSKFGFSPGNFGASSLGCLYTQYASFVPSVVGKEAYLIDFSQLGNTHVPPAIAEQFRKGYAPLTATSKAKARARGYEKGRSSLEEHSWHRYVQRQQFSEFAHLLFD